MINKSTLEKFDLTGKTAVVTGGGTGLGYSITRALLMLGAKVLIAARREDALRDAAEKLKAECATDLILTDRVDLNDRNGVKEFSERARQSLNGVDIFVGNAAYGLFKPVDAISPTELDECIRTNFTANFELMNHFLPAMRAKRWGRVLFSSSAGSVLSGNTGMAVYSATKAALNSLVKTTAVEASRDGVNINTIVIGCYMTEMLASFKNGLDSGQGNNAASALIQRLETNNMIGRLGNPRELEGVVQLLATDAGSYITGQSIPVDGGMTSMIWANEPVDEPVLPKYCSE